MLYRIEATDGFVRKEAINPTGRRLNVYSIICNTEYNDTSTSCLEVGAHHHCRYVFADSEIESVLAAVIRSHDKEAEATNNCKHKITSFLLIPVG